MPTLPVKSFWHMFCFLTFTPPLELLMFITQARTLIVCILSLGCSVPLHLYPVKGPLTDQKSVSVITAKATGLTSGTISFSLPTGETFKGPWRPILPGQVDNNLSTTWDSIYGTGFYVANVLGSRQHATAVISGTRGMVYHLELFKNSAKSSPLLGIATDTNGNTYKVTN